jgi:hypothetical protein
MIKALKKTCSSWTFGLTHLEDLKDLSTCLEKQMQIQRNIPYKCVDVSMCKKDKKLTFFGRSTGKRGCNGQR